MVVQVEKGQSQLVVNRNTTVLKTFSQALWEKEHEKVQRRKGGGGADAEETGEHGEEGKDGQEGKTGQKEQQTYSDVEAERTHCQYVVNKKTKIHGK